jgi:hypothetical protein
MSWTQVHISGLSASTSQDSLELEIQESSLFDEATAWAGPGTTILKQTNNGGIFGFLAFHSLEGALSAVERINAYDGNDACSSFTNMHAEVSNKSKKTKKVAVHSCSDNHSDLRLRRMRAKPAPKHPVLNHSGSRKI